jgi:hypothetical protein
LDKQLRGRGAIDARGLPRSTEKFPASSAICLKISPFCRDFCKSGRKRFGRCDCLSNRLRKTRRAFLQAPAFKPTCAIEHFFHT